MDLALEIDDDGCGRLQFNSRRIPPTRTPCTWKVDADDDAAESRYASCARSRPRSVMRTASRSSNSRSTALAPVVSLRTQLVIACEQSGSEQWRRGLRKATQTFAWTADEDRSKPPGIGVQSMRVHLACIRYSA